MERRHSAESQRGKVSWLVEEVQSVDKLSWGRGGGSGRSASADQSGVKTKPNRFHLKLSGVSPFGGIGVTHLHSETTFLATAFLLGLLDKEQHGVGFMKSACSSSGSSQSAAPLCWFSLSVSLKLMTLEATQCISLDTPPQVADGAHLNLRSSCEMADRQRELF